MTQEYLNMERAKLLSIACVAQWLGLEVIGSGTIRSVRPVYSGGDTKYDSLKLDVRSNRFTRYSGAADNGVTGGDPPDLVVHMKGGTLKEALAWLNEMQYGRAPDKKIPTVIPVKEKPLIDMRHYINKWCRNLMIDSDVIRYMVNERGIYPEILWSNYVGSCNLKVDDNDYAKAATFPWITYSGGIFAIRKRILAPGSRDKLSASRGSVFIHSLYGEHLISQYIPDPGFLIITEGEINALSLQCMGYHAVSIGGQGIRDILPRVKAFARSYRRVLVWTDKPEVAMVICQSIREDSPNTSVQLYSDENDANDYWLNDPGELKDIIIEKLCSMPIVPDSTQDKYARMPYDFLAGYGLSAPECSGLFVSHCPHYGDVGILDYKNQTQVYSLKNLVMVWDGVKGGVLKDGNGQSSIVDMMMGENPFMHHNPLYGVIFPVQEFRTNAPSYCNLLQMSKVWQGIIREDNDGDKYSDKPEDG